MKDLLEELFFEHLPMLSEYIDKLNKHSTSNYHPQNVDSIFEYVEFITQPLTKGMFVACDEEGEVLKDHNCKCKNSHKAISCECYNEYKAALNRVLFENSIGSTYSNQYKPPKEVDYITSCDDMTEVLFDFITIEAAINAGIKLILK